MKVIWLVVKLWWDPMNYFRWSFRIWPWLVDVYGSEDEQDLEPSFPLLVRNKNGKSIQHDEPEQNLLPSSPKQHSVESFLSCNSQSSHPFEHQQEPFRNRSCEEFKSATFPNASISTHQLLVSFLSSFKNLWGLLNNSFFEEIFSCNIGYFFNGCRFEDQVVMLQLGS